MFITIVDSDDAFSWTPTNEETGTPYESVFQLRLITDDVDRDIRKEHTRQVFDKKQRRTVDKLDEATYIAALLDRAIVGWTGIRSASSGQDLPCTSELKARLPEKWKAEILRLCAAKEAGDVVAKAAQEKNGSATTSSGKPTSVVASSAV